MREKDIENLLARYPEEFFPGEGLTLNGQQVRLGNCYADLIFTDKHDRRIIVEVKLGLLRREGAGQIMEYYGLLKQQEPDKIIELVLCANTIPPERKTFLEQAGIECKELGLSLIQTIAKRYGYQFLDEADLQQRPKPSAATPSSTAQPPAIRDGQSVWIFQGNPNRFDVLNALSDPALQSQCWQVNQHKDRVKLGDLALIWMSGKEAGIYAVAEITSEPTVMSDLPGEEKYWVNEEDRGAQRLKVMVAIRENLVNRPVYRHELVGVEELRHLSILRFWQGTNFPVSEVEWAVIRKMIDGISVQ